MAPHVDDKSRNEKRTIKSTPATDTLTETQVNPISERKREANRKNAQRSTGPKTETGKSRSRGNAIKHGFFVREMPLQRFLFTEDFSIARRLFQELVDYYQPVGPMEKIHVEMLSECCWKMRRLQIAETASIRVAVEYENDIFQIGARKSLFVVIFKVFGEAKDNAVALGYVDDALVKRAIEFSAEEWLKNDFVLANQRARDLAIQRIDGSDLGGNRALKKAQSALRRKLQRLEERCFQLEEGSSNYEAHAQHLLPRPDVMDNLLRYQTAVDRRLYRTMAALERLQRQRLESATLESLRLTM
jgi:hypothetical protein